nr:winged helix-turn-helix transcriptional regulator [Carboxylicivirga mesophila]
MIERKVFAEVPPKVEYSLSKLGKDIHPFLKGMYKGGLLLEKSIESKEG